MPYYKDTENKLHFIDDAQYEYLLPAGSVQITDAEAEQIQSAQVVEQAVVIDPVEKLKSFLAANPDVKVLLNE